MPRGFYLSCDHTGIHPAPRQGFAEMPRRDASMFINQPRILYVAGFVCIRIKDNAFWFF